MAERALSTPSDVGNPTGSLRDAARARIEDRISTRLAEVEILIARLDALDGDADLELNGDETDFSGGAEDEFIILNAPGVPMPGCPFADPEGDVDDDSEEDWLGDEFSDREARKMHRDRIRRDECDTVDRAPFWYAGKVYTQEWRLRPAGDRPAVKA